jgi:hypothetical protein
MSRTIVVRLAGRRSRHTRQILHSLAEIFADSEQAAETQQTSRISSVVSTSSGSISESVHDDDNDNDNEDESEVESDDSSVSSDAESDSGTDSDEDDEELDKLLQAAKLSAANSASRKDDDENVLGGDGDVVSFGLGEQEKQRRREAFVNLRRTLWMIDAYDSKANSRHFDHQVTQTSFVLLRRRSREGFRRSLHHRWSIASQVRQRREDTRIGRSSLRACYEQTRESGGTSVPCAPMSVY